jgi:hypothetical protein
MRRGWRGKMGKEKRTCKPAVVCGAVNLNSYARHQKMIKINKLMSIHAIILLLATSFM